MRNPAALIFRISSICMFLFAATALPLAAQNDDGDLLMRLGPTPPSRPSMQIPGGEVNLENGNVHLEFPLQSYKQRNGKSVNLALTYDSQFYSINAMPTGEGYNYLWQSIVQDQPLAAGWRTMGMPRGYFGSTTSGQLSTVACSNFNSNGEYVTGASPWPLQWWNNFIYVDPSGSEHQFNGEQIDNSLPACEYPNTTLTWYAADGSGYQIIVTVTTSSMNAQIWDKHGTLVCTSSAASILGSLQSESPCGGNIEDSNGNFTSSPEQAGPVTDELGRQIATSSCIGNCAAASYAIQFGGATIQYGTIPVNTNFPAWTGGFTGTTQYTGTIAVVESITLADGRGYQFSYDQGTSPGHYGQMTKMILPTGGEVDFTYEVVNPPNSTFFVGDLKLASLTQQGNTWTFDWSPIACAPSNEPQFGYAGLTVIPPADESGTQNQTAYSYTYSSCSSSYYKLSSYTASVYAGAPSGTPLRTADYTVDYYQNVTSVTTTLDNGMSSHSTYNYLYGVAPFIALPTSVQEYDFLGNLTRETDATYLESTPYLNQHIIDLPSSVSVYGAGGAAGGNLVAQTNYTYDGTSLTCPVSSCPTVPGHDSSYSTTSTVRGNLTGVSQMVTPGTFITTTTNYYNTLGEVAESVDGRGNETSYKHSDNWSPNDANPPWSESCVSGNTYAYPTTVTSPAGENTVSTYNDCDGSLYSTQDQNDVNANRAGTVYTYDAVQRLIQTVFADGGVQQTNYPTANLVTQKTKITGSMWSETDTTLDDLGRAIETQTAVPSSTCSQDVVTNTTYDNLGRQATVTNPYCTTSDPTYGITQTFYDALSRPTQVVEPDGSTAQTSYSGNETTVTDEANNSRQSFSDALGRLTEVEEPTPTGVATAGSGSAATSGTERHTSGSGSPGTGSIVIAGQENTTQVDPCSPQGNPPCPYTDSDYGLVGVIINGVSAGYAYYNSDTSASVASGLATAINHTSSMPVTATASGSTVSLTSKQNGTSTDYAVSDWAFTEDSNFFNPSFYDASSSEIPCPNGSTCADVGAQVEWAYNFNLTGGTSGTTYDTGTVWANVNGFQASVNYGQSSTAQSVASALGSALSASGTPVNASVSGTTISLTATETGSSSNYSLSAGSSTSQPGTFSQPSFSVSVSGSALTGGSDGIGSGALTTMYSYDALDDLTQVQQQGGTTDNTQWRTRTYAYDGLSRLVSSVNPESNTVPCATEPCTTAVATIYGYDGDGNVVTKVAPAPNQTASSTVTTTYTYDSDNRLTSKSYSNGDPTITYVYSGNAPPSGCTPPSLAITNGVGLRTAMCDAAGSEAFSYDPMGRIATDVRNLNNPANNNSPSVPASVSMTTSYTYNLDGSVASTTYPTGRTITYDPTVISQPDWAKDLTNSINYAEGAVYNPPGALTSLLLGESGAFTGINLNSTYNNRLQPSSILAYSTGSAELNLAFCYYPLSGGSCPTGPQSGNNGNISYIKNGVTSSRSEAFTYDALNRITSAASGSWGESYSLDAWGNLQQFVPYSGLTLADKSASQTANAQNRIIGFCYDTAGNLLDQGGCESPHTYTYNAEGQLTYTANTTYVYDGDGKRVEKYMLSGQDLAFQQMYWYGGGNILDETNAYGDTSASDSAFHEYIFFGGARIARRDGTTAGDVEFYLADHLGSSRVLTDASGNTLYDVDYCPYGLECYVATDDSPGNNYKFTGKERDTESGLDNFSARYNASSIARFMSPDPSGIFLGDPTDPQQLNLYSYVRNNPLNSTDPTGLDCAYLDNNGGTNPNGPGGFSVDQNSTSEECSQNGGTWFNGTVDQNSIQTDANSDWVYADSESGVSEYSCNGSSCDPDSVAPFSESIGNSSPFIVYGQGTTSGWVVSNLNFDQTVQYFDNHGYGHDPSDKFDIFGHVGYFDLRDPAPVCSNHLDIKNNGSDKPATGKFHEDVFNPHASQDGPFSAAFGPLAALVGQYAAHALSDFRPHLMDNSAETCP